MKNTLKYSLHMQKNPAHPEEAEKAYATLQLNGVLDINALADHMSNHNSIYSKGTIVGVITDMCHCIKEAITEGNAVMLGERVDVEDAVELQAGVSLLGLFRMERVLLQVQRILECVFHGNGLG